MIYKHKTQEHEVQTINIEYIDIPENCATSDKAHYIYYTDGRGSVCKMPAEVFYDQFETI